MYYITFSAPTANLLGMKPENKISYKFYNRPTSAQIDKLKREFAITYNNELDEIRYVITKDN